MKSFRFGGFTGVVGCVLVVLALVLGAGGVWLVALGGSAYYVVAAMALLLAGVLLWQRSTLALWVCAALVVGTLAWALVEVGLDWWPLAARLDVLFVIGAVLLLPWLTRSLGPRLGSDARAAGTSRSRSSGSGVSVRRGAGLALASALVATMLVSIASWFTHPHDLAGALPPSQGVMAALDDAVRGVLPGEWHAYGRTGFGQRYSPLKDIDVGNVARLEVAWRFQTGDLRGQPGDPVETTDEVTPLKIGDRLFFCTPHQDVIALNATTGAEVWRYKPQIQSKLALQHLTCRGLSYSAPRDVGGAPSTVPLNESASAASAAASGSMAPAGDRTSAQAAQPVAARSGKTIGACAAKLFMPTADGRLIALDPDTGAVCSAFGKGAGQIDLWAGMPNLRPGSYYSTSPVVVTAKLVIVGGTVLDNVSTHEQSGVIRAFDVDSGALVWNWDSGNPAVTAPLAPGQTYTVNSPNSWSISSVDEALGMVYVPMGNQPPDQWGGNRSAAVERYSSSVVALDLATGPCDGCSRPSTTTCGTTTSLRNRASST